MAPNSINMLATRSIWRSRSMYRGVAVAALLGTSLLVMFGLMYWRSSDLLFATLDRSVTEQIELLSARPSELLPFMIASRMNRQPMVVTLVGLFEASGTPVIGEITVLPEGLTRNGKVQPVTAPGQPDQHWRAASRILPDGRILIVARQADEILAVRQSLVHGAVGGILPAILLSLAGGALAGLTTERRLRRLNGVAERVIAGDLSERLPASSDGDELDRLCFIVNRVLDRLEEGVVALQDVGGNIAHDLRTPLTAMRARLERSLAMASPDTPIAPLIAQSLDGADQALSIITALLRISDIEHSRRTAAFETCDLGQLLLETAQSYQPLAEDKSQTFICDIQQFHQILGDRQMITEAIVNLVDNAVKFTPMGGTVTMTLSGPPGQPLVTIQDTGPGIASVERERVFQRFFRGDTSRSTPGNGLGLSLVAAIIRLHGFQIEVSNIQLGCCIILKFWS